MKKFVLLFLFGGSCFAQLTYSVSKTTALSSSAEVITVQQPASNGQVVRFVSAYIDSSVDCGVTIEQGGTEATNTALTPAPLNVGQRASNATAFHTSNVGTGTVVTRAGVYANSGLVIDLTRLSFIGSGTTQNLTLRTASCTGTVNIVITFKEGGN